MDPYDQLKKHSVFSRVTNDSEDHEIIALSTRSKQRRQAAGLSVNFKDETNVNGDLRNESRKDSRLRISAEIIRLVQRRYVAQCADVVRGAEYG